MIRHVIAEISLKELKDAARHLGMTVRLRDGEYRVAFPKDEPGAYYTNDAADALGTMKDMYKRKNPMTKNPSRRKAKKNPRRSFGKKRTLKSAVRKIRAHVPQRYVICAKVNGVKYFFNGRGFDSVGSHAAAYVNKAHAASVSRSIRGFLPHKIKSLSVEAL